MKAKKNEKSEIFQNQMYISISMNYLFAQFFENFRGFLRTSRTEPFLSCRRTVTLFSLGPASSSVFSVFSVIVVEVLEVLVEVFIVFVVFVVLSESESLESPFWDGTVRFLFIDLASVLWMYRCEKFPIRVLLLLKTETSSWFSKVFPVEKL